MGAKKARPEMLVAAFIGEEAFNETAMDIETSVRNDAPVLLIVKNNRSVPDTDGGKSKKLAVARFHQGVDISSVASALGAKAYRVEKPADVAARRRSSGRAGRTAVVDGDEAHERPAPLVGPERAPGEG
jgi:thiamine pyrophosphate-dependent acetolactate synthase large subunit-like protein